MTRWLMKSAAYYDDPPRRYDLTKVKFGKSLG